MIKKTICLLALSILCTASQAEVETILHYNLGKSGNITYAAAPEEIPPVTGAESLISVGKPVFFADAPENKRKLGEISPGSRFGNPHSKPTSGSLG